tara:strand:- start:2904 stop:5015 length:2112 start_codon:yes stop_codon:yes gene_type:complete
MPNVKQSAQIHSVILNLNKNYSNNTGSSFSQIVNRTLELQPNTLVALYSGNIVRKPIVIEENTLLDIELPSQFPTVDQSLLPSVTTNIDDIINVQAKSISTVIPRGYYSKVSFGRILCELCNDILQGSAYQEVATNSVVPIASGNEMEIFTPYRMFFEVKDNNVWLGLRRTQLEPPGLTFDEFGPNRVTLEDLDDGQNTTANVTVAVDNERLIFQPNFRTTNWDSYALGNNPIMPHCYGHLSDEDTLPIDIGWTSVNINVDPVAVGDQTLEFCYVMNNSYFTSAWNSQLGPGVATAPLQSQLVDVNEKPNVVNGLIGAYLTAKTTAATGSDPQKINANSSFLTFYINANMMGVDEAVYNGNDQSNINLIATSPMRSLLTIDLDKYGINLGVLNSLWCEVYAVDVSVLPRINMPNGLTEDNYEYYFRWYLRTPYSNVNEMTLLFDSKNVGARIPNHIVDTAYLFSSIPAESNVDTKYQSAGMCPQFYFKGCSTDLKVSQPTINSNIQYNNLEEVFKYLTGIRSYNFQPKPGGVTNDTTKNTASLQNVLGVGDNESTSGDKAVNQQTLFNPSKFPTNRSMAGLTKLSSDDQRYNIELNLPVKAYNTTEQNTNDIGQSRTILYNTNASLGTDDNPTVGLINKELQPSNLKYLSLNNPEPIKLNTLDVNIRRAKTNALAEEITDASLEILFYSESNDSNSNSSSRPY